MNYLEKILETKQIEIGELDTLQNYKKEFQSYPRLDIRTINWSANLDVISEIKRKSPSKGELSEIKNPVELATKYQAGGSCLISVLTDKQYFGAEKDDLLRIRENVETPVLRKDFIISDRQVYESYFMGADAILLIVAAFKNKEDLSYLFELAISIGLGVLVEAHDKDEYEIALEIGASIIGVNTRDLTTFEENAQAAIDIFKNKSQHVVNVWESGIRDLEDAHRAYESGADALLIGQGLVQSKDPTKFLCDIRHIG